MYALLSLQKEACVAIWPDYFFIVRQFLEIIQMSS